MTIFTKTKIWPFLVQNVHLMLINQGSNTQECLKMKTCFFFLTCNIKYFFLRKMSCEHEQKFRPFFPI